MTLKFCLAMQFNAVLKQSAKIYPGKLLNLQFHKNFTSKYWGIQLPHSKCTFNEFYMQQQQQCNQHEPLNQCGFVHDYSDWFKIQDSVNQCITLLVFHVTTAPATHTYTHMIYIISYVCILHFRLFLA